MSIDYTSAALKNPKPRWNALHVSLTSAKCKSKEAVFREINQVYNNLVKTYQPVLSLENLTRARMEVIGKNSVEEYVSFFLSQVLFNYRIWEVEESWLEKLQSLIEANNPEWIERFKRDKSFKLKSLKRK